MKYNPNLHKQMPSTIFNCLILSKPQNIQFKKKCSWSFTYYYKKNILWLVDLLID